VCGVSFYQKIDLKIHSLQHTGTKQHECTFCKRKFKQAAHLKYHLHSHLKQINENSEGGYPNFHNNNSQNSTDNIKFESVNENSSNNMHSYGISNDNNNLSKTTEDDDEEDEEDNDDNEMSYNEEENVDEEDIDIDDNSDENEINESADKNNVSLLILNEIKFIKQNINNIRFFRLIMKVFNFYTNK
jgi:hypothetical protein